ncbi:MAG: TonB-dependent receptor [Chitinophagaceae bacterium]|nr:TonB-dependent receptor [Chitinophagaceae bacterium]
MHLTVQRLHYRKGSTITKTLLIMKLTAIILLGAFLQVSAKGFGQQSVTLSEKNVSIKQIFREINRQTGYKFFYEEELVKQAGKININVKNASIDEVLKTCFRNLPFEYSIEENTIVVKPLIKQPEEKATEAADIDARGIVVDENGNPLAGASVKLKGTDKGTTTDAGGNFLLQIPNKGGKLIISYVGYETLELALSGNDAVRIVLKPAESKIEEVVVVGYGSQKKVNLTGSVASVKGEELNKRQVVNPVSALQGLLPGVRITQNSGQPGAEGLGIEIRGMTTYSSAGSSPLVLINGVPGSLSDLNPNVIESISVLKDAASASIYGARASNGVILVTTKNGSGDNGKLTVSYNLVSQFNKATMLPDLVTNAVEYMELYNLAKTNSGATSQFYPDSVIDLYRNSSDPLMYPKNADWAALMFGTAPTLMHSLSVSGGTRQTSYDFTLGYIDQQGIMQAFNYKKYNAMLNLASEVNSNIKLGISIGVKSGDQSQPRNGAQDAFYQTLAHTPTALPWLPDGSGRYTYRAYSWELVRPNQFAANEQIGRNIDYALLSQIWAEIKITKGLKWYTKGAINGNVNRYKEFSQAVPLYGYLTPDDASTSSNIPGNGLSTSMSQTLYKNLYSYLEYENKIGEHRFSAQAGYSQEQEKYDILSGSRPNYSVGGALQELNAGDATPQYNGGTSTEWALQSGFGRVKYDFASKYLVESNLRYDGSSRLSGSHRWGVFPSFSAGWRISEEAFMQGLKSKGLVNDLKLRGSWGKLGNQNIGLYPYQALLNVGGNYPFGNTLNTGAYQSALNNDNITWETTTMTDIGLDLRVLDHLNLSIDWYKKVTTDILRTAQVAGVVGLSAPTINGGAMTNRGIDLALNYNNAIRSGIMDGFVYSVGFNISGFRNETSKFGVLQDNGSTAIKEGLPWNSFYLLQWDGIFQTEEEVAKSPKQFGENTAPGDLKFKDINGDNVIDNKDRVIMKDGVFPSYSYGLTLNASWKGFDFYTFFQGVQGLKGIFGYNMAPGITPFFSGIPPLKEMVKDAWTPENHSNTMPQLQYYTFNGAQRIWNHPSTFLLRDMSYLRVKQLQLGYTLPENIINKIRLKYARIFIAGDNLFTFTKFLGTDPEKPAGSYLTYPQNKAFSFGLSVKL